jgi:hypothetical protein
VNRNSRKALTLAGHKSSIALEQAVELAMGVLPKEFESWDEVPPAGRKLWPTPTASRWSGLQSHGANAILGPLNPEWIEWLMGYPAGWTDCGD